MNLSQEQAARLGFWAALLLSVFAWAPTAYPGYWQATEGFVPVFNAVQTSAIAGIATPPDVWRGMGNGAFLPAQPFLVLGLEPTTAVRIVFALAFVLGGMGTYIWLRHRLGDRAAGLAALVFMLWPPLLMTVYTRGSLADALVIGILPLALAGLAAYVETRTPSAAGVAVLSLLWIWRTQAGLAVVVTLVLLAYVLLVERSRLAALVVSVSGAAGLVSLIPLWNLQAVSPIDFGTGFVSLYTLLAGTPMTANPSASAAIPATLGAAGLLLGLTTIWFWYSSRLGWRTNVLARMLAFAFGWIGIAVLLALPLSAGFWYLTGLTRFFTYPWQILLVAAPFIALAAGSLVTLQPVLAQTRFWGVLVALVVLGSYPYLRADFTTVAPPDRPVAIFGARPDLVILSAELEQDRVAHTATLDVTWQVLHTPHFDYNVFLQALVAEDGSFRTVAQLDTQPLQGTLPATQWQPGQIYTDTYRLDLTPWLAAEGDSALPDQTLEEGTLPGGPLRYDFGYYDWRDGARLPIDGGIDDKLMFYGP